MDCREPVWIRARGSALAIGFQSARRSLPPATDADVAPAVHVSSCHAYGPPLPDLHSDRRQYSFATFEQIRQHDELFLRRTRLLRFLLVVFATVARRG